MGLKEKLKGIPQTSGVYIFKDKKGKVLYVGKANNLKKRVHSYFGNPSSFKTEALVTKIDDLSYILTPTPARAQLLEASLIKKLLPAYNVSLRDDKTFPLIRISQECFPIVSICRRKKKNKQEKAVYFGPYTNAKLLRQALKTIRRIFGFRSCSKMPKAPCLYYRLKLCPAPCAGKISSSAYKELIKEISMFIDSKHTELLEKLSRKMKEAVNKQRFEDAGRIRDQIYSLGAITPEDDSCGLIRELKDLQRLLRLSRLPQRIEAFDISNISGKQACGSMVSFYQGRPDKDNYRRFRIKGKERINDYKMLKEVIQRRYVRALEEKFRLPDLIIIDGGRAHLLTAAAEIKILGIDIPLLSIAKPARNQDALENIYIKDQRNPIKLDSGAPALNLVRRIRDEAHRFAVAYHHVLRRKKVFGK